MRKFTMKANTNSSRIVTEPTRQPVRKMTEQGYSSRKIDNLSMFHDQLMLKQKLILSTHRRTKSTFNPTYNRQKQRRKSIRKDLMNATKEITELRKELSQSKIQTSQQKHQQKLSQFIDLLKISIQERKADRMVYSHRQQPQLLIYPIPIPYPIYNYQGERFPSSQRQSREIEYSSFKNGEKKKAARLRKIKTKFMKVANAILFTIYLKHYCKRIRQSRKIRFHQLLPYLQPALNSITMQLRKLLKPFFTLLFVKRQVSYDIQIGENKIILKGKTDAVRKLILMILNIVKQWIQSSIQNKRTIQTIYYLCRHGNYSCTAPILTPEQLEMTCISNTFGYVSASQNLQKAAFMNLLYIKIVIYNILLSPQTIFNQFQDDNLNNNLYVIASVLYELAIEVQDQYILTTSKSYKIGNSGQIKGVVVSSPLLYKNALKVEGELISGLKQQSWTKKYFNFQNWTIQKHTMKQALHTLHCGMANYHKNISKKFY